MPGTEDTGAAKSTRRPPTRANYLALPSRDLAFLKNTLRLYLREDRVAEVVQAFGARCGAGQVVQSQVEAHEPKELAEVIPAMCAQIGLAKIRTVEHGPDHLKFDLTRVAESPSLSAREPRMDFTRGFLEGAVAQLLGRRVRGTLHPGSEGPDHAVVDLRWSAALAGGEETGAGGASGPSGPAPPSARSEPAGLRPGAYLIEEGHGVDALTPFTEAARLRSGLAITAGLGRELRGRRDLAHLQVYDLTETESTGLLSLEAGNLPALLSSVDDFVKRAPSGVVLVADLQLLLRANGVEPTRNFLIIAAELLAEGKGTLLVAAPTGDLPSGDRALLLRTLKPYVRGA